jgi:basic amino acid/polyamine antiporter, APA family
VRTVKNMPEERQLKRVLSFKVILLITINAIMGTGIFFLPALGARYAGPASLISWALIALFAIYVSTIFAELTSMFPTSGGVYEFCKNAFGDFYAFMIGWITFITANVTIAMLIVGAIEYLAPINAPFIKIAICIFFVLVFHLIAHFGMKTSGTMLVAFSFITLSTIALLLIPGFANINLSNLTPFFIFPISSIFLAIFYIAETFFGWETATFLAGETINGEKAVPKALIIATIVTGILSFLVALVSMGVVRYDKLGTAAAPISLIAGVLFSSPFAKVIAIMVYLSLIGSVAGWIVASPRLLLSMAKDKLFISQLSKIHPKYKSPYKSIWFQAIFVIILIFITSGQYEKVLHLLLPLAFLQYSAVALALFVLRIKRKNAPRPYKAPFGKIGSILSIVIFAAMLIYWSINDPGAVSILKLIVSILALGIPIYFLLKVYYDPSAVIKLNDMFAYFAYITEKISLPRGVKKEIVMLLGNLKGKTILEFGCSIGTLTVELASRVSSTGKIFATNISAKELLISKKRIESKGHEHVVFIHDMHQANRIHPLIPQVDAIVSFGMLTYIQDIKKVLSEMSDVLNDEGKVVLVDWVNFFHVIPDVEWLTHDELIRSVFRDAGFAVTITRKKGFLWDYLYIHGIKTKNEILYV